MQTWLKGGSSWNSYELMEPVAFTYCAVYLAELYLTPILKTTINICLFSYINMDISMYCKGVIVVTNRRS